MMFDALLACGGRPANYTEVGGNPSEKKVYGLARAILSKPGVRGLIVAGNITNNTQVDVIASGVVAAIKDSGIDPRSFPVLVRYAGVNDAAGRRILAEAGIDSYGEEITLTMAAEKMMEKMTQVRGR
jgi:succinyl-CoA synthetase beta subunit/citryl-CoA synthetase large subunit